MPGPSWSLGPAIMVLICSWGPKKPPHPTHMHVWQPGHGPAPGVGGGGLELPPSFVAR